MCFICAELIKGSITSKEAMNNLSELAANLEPEHVFVVDDLIQEYENKELAEGDEQYSSGYRDRPDDLEQSD
jgi:hypothetical protein